MTPSFIQIPAAQPAEPPEDLEIVRKLYEIQQERLKILIEAQKSFKKSLQQMLLAMSFLAILLGYLLQTFVSYYLQIYIAKLSFNVNPNSQFGLLLTGLIVICATLWGITTLLSVYGLFKPEVVWHLGYKTMAHLELELRVDVYDTFKWYSETITTLQSLIDLMTPRTRTQWVIIIATRFLISTIFFFVTTFLFILFTLPLSLPLS